MAFIEITEQKTGKPMMIRLEAIDTIQAKEEANGGGVVMHIGKYEYHVDVKYRDIKSLIERNLTERPAEEKPQEIDWTKVETGTQVIGSDSDDFYPCNTREFFTYRPDLEYKFWVFDGEKDEAYGYKYCKIV